MAQRISLLPVRVLLFTLLAYSANIANAADRPTVTLSTNNSAGTAWLDVVGFDVDADDVVRVTGDGIVPITIEPNAGPAVDVPLLLLPGAALPIEIMIDVEPHAIDLRGAAAALAQFDAAAYEPVRIWRPQRPTAGRRRVVAWSGVGVACVMLLIGLSPRRRGAIWVVVGISGSVVLLVLIATRPTRFVETRGTFDWHAVTSPQPVRLPIRDGARWRPVFESTGHLHALAPRIVVGGRETVLELHLPAGAKLMVE